MQRRSHSIRGVISRKPWQELGSPRLPAIGGSIVTMPSMPVRIPQTIVQGTRDNDALVARIDRDRGLSLLPIMSILAHDWNVDGTRAGRCLSLQQARRISHGGEMGIRLGQKSEANQPRQGQENNQKRDYSTPDLRFIHGHE